MITEPRFFTFGYDPIDPVDFTVTTPDGSPRSVRALGSGDVYIILSDNSLVQVPCAYFCPDARENTLGTHTLAQSGIVVSEGLDYLRFPDLHTLDTTRGRLLARPSFFVPHLPPGARDTDTDRRLHDEGGKASPSPSLPAKKRPRTMSSVPSPPQAAAATDELSTYELQRQLNIAANAARLSALGLAPATSSTPKRPKTPRIPRTAPGVVDAAAPIHTEDHAAGILSRSRRVRRVWRVRPRAPGQEHHRPPPHAIDTDHGGSVAGPRTWPLCTR